MSARPIVVFAFLVAANLGGCQLLGGFEDFAMGGADAGAGGSPAEGGSKGGRDAESDGSAAETLGIACSASTQCSDALVCVYGFCRVPCTDDTACRQGSDCLRDGTRGGCQLSGESCTTNGDCGSAELVCGLDGTCRVDCSTRSCDAATQRCVASACVSTVGERSKIWDCGGSAEGAVVCDGAKLEVCNVLSPGLAEIATCKSAGVCQASIPASGVYDPESAPTCRAGCTAGGHYCDGATLLECKQDGSGPVDAGETCATAALCRAAVDAQSATCLAPACARDDTRCGGGQVQVAVQQCNDDRTGFADLAYCESGTSQCNPGASACVDLDVDAREVTVGDYDAWLAENPTSGGQAPGCTWNTTFVPVAAPACAPSCTGSTCPQACVDWCDAYAYCQSKGRRLCGRISGGMNPFDRYADAGSSQWMNACSAGGQFDWGPGAAPSTGAQECTYSGSQLGKAYAVGSRANCRSPSPGYHALFDLSGNVEEWEDSCEAAITAASADASDACRTRGGSFDASRDATRCDAVPASARKRSDVSPSLGFRCCG